MYKTLIIISSIVALAAAFSLPIKPPSIPSIDPSSVLCQTIQSQPARASEALQQLVMALQQNAQKMPKTLAYLQNPSNQAALLSGNTNCLQFFSGLMTPLTIDYQTIGVPSDKLQQQVTQYITNLASMFLSKIG